MRLQDISKTHNIIKVAPDDTLSSILGLLESSHDAAFVMEEENLLGVINPYYCLIKKSYPSNTKAKHCLIKPPRIEAQDSVQKTARLMMESKIHYLPVFDGAKLAGVITAKRLMQEIMTDKRFTKPLSTRMTKGKKIITISEGAYVSKALQLYKTNKISKLVVVNSAGKLSGMLTYYDIIQHLSTPIESQKLSSREGSKLPIMKKPIKNFSQKQVLTLRPEDTYVKAIETMLSEDVGSVVIVDKYAIPLGIVTARDILAMYSLSSIPSRMMLKVTGLSKGSAQVVKLFTDRFRKTLLSRKDIQKAEVKVVEKKQGGLFEGAISIFTKGKRFIVREEGKNLHDTLKNLKEKVRRVVSK